MAVILHMVCLWLGVFTCQWRYLLKSDKLSPGTFLSLTPVSRGDAVVKQVRLGLLVLDARLPQDMVDGDLFKQEFSHNNHFFLFFFFLDSEIYFWLPCFFGTLQFHHSNFSVCDSWDAEISWIIFYWLGSWSVSRRVRSESSSQYFWSEWRAWAGDDDPRASCLSENSM